MIKVVISGANGEMGHVLSDEIRKTTDMSLEAGFDIKGSSLYYPIYADPKDFSGAADVLIDFSNPSFLPKVIDFCLKRRIPAVIATTGLSQEDLELIEKASKRIPILQDNNMSLGVVIMTELVKNLAKMLMDSGLINEAEFELIEVHHDKKVDAPSGTAKKLVNALNSVLPEEQTRQPVYDRHEIRQRRTINEIGIHAVRLGRVTGEHELKVAFGNEILTISHEALAKSAFAIGAIKAAKFIMDKENGLYSIKDMYQL